MWDVCSVQAVTSYATARLIQRRPVAQLCDLASKATKLVIGYADPSGHRNVDGPHKGWEWP